MTILHYIFCIADHPIIVIGIIKIISFLIITYQQHTVLVGIIQVNLLPQPLSFQQGQVIGSRMLIHAPENNGHSLVNVHFQQFLNRSPCLIYDLVGISNRFLQCIFDDRRITAKGFFVIRASTEAR